MIMMTMIMVIMILILILNPLKTAKIITKIIIITPIPYLYTLLTLINTIWAIMHIIGVHSIG